MAELPSLPPDLLARLITRGKARDKTLAEVPLGDLLRGTAEQPGTTPLASGDIATLLQSDAVRAALGRIACMYDGGHLLE